MKQPDMEKLIAEELLGKALNDEERRQLENWLNADPANREQYARICAGRFSATRYDTYRQLDADKAFRGFLKKTRRTSRLKTTMWAVAACLIPLLLIGSTIWLSFRQQPSAQPVAAIAPGTTHAVLQTAEGDSVVLDKAILAQAVVPLGNGVLHMTPQGIVIPQADNTNASPAANGTTPQNILRTADNGEFLITLEDGTTVHLNYNTTLRYPEHFAAEERMVYLEGEAYFEVAPDAQRPFKVMTRDVTIRQYGTSFNVNTFSKRYTDVVLVEGSISVLTGDEEYRLRPNERMRLDKTSARLSIRPVDVKPYIAWHEGRFIFDNESLGDIMETLSHWYGVDVVFDEPTLRYLHFTGNMSRYDSLTPLLRSICQTVGLRIVIKNRTIYIYQ